MRLALRLAGLLISGIVGNIIGPGEPGSCSSGDSAIASAKLKPGDSAVTLRIEASWSSAVEGLSLRPSAISDIRRLDGDPDLLAGKPLVLILLIAVCLGCLTVVPALLSKICPRGCILVREGKVADIGPFGMGINRTSCASNDWNLLGEPFVPDVMRGLKASGVSGNSCVINCS